MRRRNVATIAFCAVYFRAYDNPGRNWFSCWRLLRCMMVLVVRKDSLTQFLYIATYLFLGLPYLVFLAGWIRQPYSAVLLLLLLAGAVFGLKRIFAEYCIASDDTFLPVRSLILVLLPAVLIGLLSGAGGWGIQDSDWLKHNGILRDLVTDSWPVIYELHGERLLLTYYTAYQLPAAFIGKLFGWSAANHALFLYTLAGLCLAALWVWLLAGAKYWWFALVFFLFSGMDVVGQVFSEFYLQSSLQATASVLFAKLTEFQHIEWWAGWGFAAFNSNASLAMWVPNQGVSGWLIMALILNDARIKCLHITGAFYLALSTLWAPFVSLGLLPFVIALVLYQWRQAAYSSVMIRESVSVSNLAGLALGLVVVTYIMARFQDYALPMDIDGVYRETITLTFIRQPNLFAVRYLLFLILEFAVLHALLFWYLSIRRKAELRWWRGLLILSSIMLVALPILNWGFNNEPAMRTSIPALFITALVTLVVLADDSTERRAIWARRATVSLLAIGVFNPVMEIGRHVQGTYQRGALISIPREETVQTIFELQESRYKNYYSFIQQYLGSVDSYFVTYLAKK